LYGGTGLVATQFPPPSLWGYNRELRAFEYSAAKAQALLRGAGLAKVVSEVTWVDGNRELSIFVYMSRSRHSSPNPKEPSENMLDDVGRVFIANKLSRLAFRKRVEGYVPHPPGSEYFDTVEIQ